MGEDSLPESSLEGLKEIGNLASWTVSTAKPGNGVEQLRDEDTNLFWQFVFRFPLVFRYLIFMGRSDGPQPHTINIHFAKRVFVKRIRMYLDFENDESYTPTRMSIFSGTGYQDLQEVTVMNFEQPSGWIDVNLEGVHEEYAPTAALPAVITDVSKRPIADVSYPGLYSRKSPKRERYPCSWTTDLFCGTVCTPCIRRMFLTNPCYI